MYTRQPEKKNRERRERRDCHRAFGVSGASDLGNTDGYFALFFVAAAAAADS